jgi:branched-chain amino acid transport system permease protein
MHISDILLQQVVNGLALGMMYALLALGFTMVYGIIELINFAHFSVFMTGTFLGLTVLHLFGFTGSSPSLTGLSLLGMLLVIFPVTMLLTGTVGVLIERICLRPVRGVSGTAPMITTIGVAFVMINVVLMIWGPQSKPFPRIIPDRRWLIGQAEISLTQIFLAVTGLFLMLVLNYLVKKTALGKAMRATAQDMDAARLMGIDVDRTISLTFLLGGMLAGAAGLIYALYNGTIQFNQGFTAGLIAFTAAVMGGIGNLKGAVVGGLIIGVIQSISDTHFGQVWTPAVVFAILILIMVFKPEGLFGEETREG